MITKACNNIYAFSVCCPRTRLLNYRQNRTVKVIRLGRDNSLSQTLGLDKSLFGPSMCTCVMCIIPRSNKRDDSYAIGRLNKNSLYFLSNTYHADAIKTSRDNNDDW